MPVTRFERSSEVDFGVSGDLDSRTVHWIAEGTEQTSGPTLDSEIIDYARVNTDLEWDGIPRSQINIQQILPFIYRVDAVYSFNAPAPTSVRTASAESSFTYGAQANTIKYSFETVGSFPDGAPSFDNAINVEGEGINQTIGGADSLIGVGQKSFTFAAEETLLTPAYERIVENLVGRTNNKAYMGRQRGEVLFMGARGASAIETATGRVPKSDAAITFDFEVRERQIFPPSPNENVGGRTTIAGITVSTAENPLVINPFDYVWVHYVPVKGPDGKPAKKAKSVYIERILEEGDFDQLGLPI